MRSIENILICMEVHASEWNAISFSGTNESVIDGSIYTKGYVATKMYKLSSLFFQKTESKVQRYITTMYIIKGVITQTTSNK